MKTVQQYLSFTARIPFFNRTTTSFLGLIAGALLHGAVSAQQLQPQEPVPTTFRVVAINQQISGLFYDLDKKPVEITASPSLLSASYTAPGNGKITFYKLVQPADPKAAPTKVTIADEAMPTGGPYIVLVATTPAPLTNAPQTGIRILDDSWKIHPQHSLRVLNFSTRRTAIQIGDKTHELAPGQFVLSPPKAGGSMIRFKAAALEEGLWVVRVQSPQQIYRRTRQTVLIQDSIPTEETPDPRELNVYNLIDTTQPPGVQNTGSVALNHATR